MVSIIIPVYNNAAILPLTYQKISQSLGEFGLKAEIIFIDDASQDKSFEIIIGLMAEDDRVRILRLERNGGQQLALVAGLRIAAGKVIITTDADLPIAPAEFNRLIDKVAQGYDFVLAARKDFRHKARWRVLGSFIVHLLLKVCYRFEITDFGCGTSAIDRRLVEKLSGSLIPLSPIKLALLSLSEHSCEIPLTYQLVARENSSYSFLKLFLLGLRIFAFRWQARKFL